jgi:mannose-6-phosphate isomerase-like protein (cupin superfamily)
MSAVEAICQNQAPLAYVVRAEATQTTTSFLTGADATFQAGFVVHPAGGAVVPHVHRPVARTVVGTSEVLMVRQGRCIVDVYGEDRSLVASRELRAGDLVILVGCGHGFRMIEDTVLFEIKQGPYNGQTERERFDPLGERAGG